MVKCGKIKSFKSKPIGNGVKYIFNVEYKGEIIEVEATEELYREGAMWDVVKFQCGKVNYAIRLFKCIKFDVEFSDIKNSKKTNYLSVKI